jgi:hypothetical protein
MLAFLDPDKVHESVLREGGDHLNEGDFEFLGDEMEYVLTSQPRGLHCADTLPDSWMRRKLF